MAEPTDLVSSKAKSLPVRPPPKESFRRAMAIVASGLKGMVRDVGLQPRLKEIYLLGGPRSLTRLVRSGYVPHASLMRAAGIRPKSRWDVHEASYWDELEYVVLDTMRGVDPSFEGWSVLPIPDPGGPQSRWFSHKTQAWTKPVKVARYSLCDTEPIALPGRQDGPALLELPYAKISGTKKPLQPVFLANAFGVEDLVKIETCGGLLWPSLALSWKVTPSFGDVVALMDVSMLPRVLTGSKSLKSGFLLAPTDAWTPTGRQLEQYEKAVVFERKGNAAWWSGSIEQSEGGWGQRGLQDDLVSTGYDATSVVGGMAPDAAYDRVTTMAGMWRRVRELQAFWNRLPGGIFGYPNTDTLFEAVWERSRGHDQGLHYPYLEGKALGKVPLSPEGPVVAIFYPDRLKNRMRRFFERVGFQGFAVPVPWNGPLRGQMTREEEALWAQDMTAAIQAWATEPCPAWTGPRGQSGLWSSAPYQATAGWSAQYDYEYGGQLLWRRGSC